MIPYEDTVVVMGFNAAYTSLEMPPIAERVVIVSDGRRIGTVTRMANGTLQVHNRARCTVLNMKSWPGAMSNLAGWK